jgi:hypothetical protein
VWIGAGVNVYLHGMYFEHVNANKKYTPCICLFLLIKCRRKNLWNDRNRKCNAFTWITTISCKISFFSNVPVWFCFNGYLWQNLGSAEENIYRYIQPVYFSIISENFKKLDGLCIFMYCWTLFKIQIHTLGLKSCKCIANYLYIRVKIYTRVNLQTGANLVHVNEA